MKRNHGKPVRQGKYARLIDGAGLQIGSFEPKNTLFPSHTDHLWTDHLVKEVPE